MKIKTFGQIALWIATLAFIALVLVLAAPPETFCQPGESCLREWIAATSGWAAAVAAGITVLVIYRQVQEMRRQFDFAMGDVFPTVECERPVRNPAKNNWMRVELRYTNLNSARAHFDRLICYIDTEPVLPRRVSLHGSAGYSEKDDFSSFSLEGWRDRTKPASFAVLVMHFDIAASFEARFVMEGKMHKANQVPFEIEARTNWNAI